MTDPKVKIESLQMVDYKPRNKDLVIGDFGEKARKLFDNEKISEGHYLELLHKIGISDTED